MWPVGGGEPGCLDDGTVWEGAAVEEATATCDLREPLGPSAVRGSGGGELRLPLKRPDGAEDDLFMFAPVPAPPPLENAPGR